MKMEWVTQWQEKEGSGGGVGRVNGDDPFRSWHRPPNNGNRGKQSSRAQRKERGVCGTLACVLPQFALPRNKNT